MHAENVILQFPASGVLMIHNTVVGLCLKSVSIPGFYRNKGPHYQFDIYLEGALLMQ